MPMRNKCLSIAGFDNSGGAGLQADLKTFSALSCYGMTAVTAIAVQNTCGVRNCYPIPQHILAQQLESIFDDIAPDSIKIGMLFNSQIIATVTEALRQFAGNIPIILDPVMVSKNGEQLLQNKAQTQLINQILPYVTLVTPNIFEAYKLAGEVVNEYQLARSILRLGPRQVLIKGGHHSHHQKAYDLLMTHSGHTSWFSSHRVQTHHTHGTGCTLSAAITAYLAQGYPTDKACQYAKNYLTRCLQAVTNGSVGQGVGPVHHFYHWW